MKFSLPSFALKRPITVAMLSVCVLGLGVIAWTRIPLQFLPEASTPFINCRIAYPGATPQQVEEEVTIPAEGAFRTIPGLSYLRTKSDSDGAFLHMRFDLDTDMTLATAEVRDRIERLKLELPQEIDTILIERFSSNSLPVVILALLAERDEEQVVHRVRTILAPRLRRIDGVADVFIRSTRPEQEILIEFRQDTLRSMNLSLYELVGALRASSLNISVGQLMAGGQKHYVRAVSEYRSLEDIRNLVVAPGGLRLSEVANVRFWARDPEWYATIDGKGGAFVMAIKESEANTVDTCRAVRETVAELEDDPLFEGATPFIFFDQSEFILTALNNLRNAGIYGGCMALIVLFMFLHRVRPTIIVALAIPTSLVVALVVMFLGDMSMNIISMVSMIVAIGLLVDNSIVVVENIIRYRQLGHDRFDSARRGATEVGLAVTAATSTTWVVFLPLFFMEMGRMRVFMRELAIPLTVALAASLLIALTLIPLAMSRMRKKQAESGIVRLYKRMTSRFQALQIVSRIRPIHTIILIYTAILRTVLRWRLASFMLLAGLLYITVLIPFGAVGTQDMPKMDTRRVDLDIDFDQNFSVGMIAEHFNMIEERLDARREELGIKHIFKFHNKERGEIEIILYTEDDGPEWVNPTYSTRDVLEEIDDMLPEELPGLELSLEMASAGDEREESGIRVRMRGDDPIELERQAEEFMATMRRIDELGSIEIDREAEKREMRLHIDEDIAGRAGIPPLQIAQTVDAALRGARLPYMKYGGREVPVWAQFHEEDRKSRKNLENITLFGENQEPMQIHQLVNYSKAPSPATIERINGKNAITLEARSSTENLGLIRAKLLQAIETFDLPQGYTIQLGHGLEELKDNMLNFTQALTMAIILIYLVMCALFESYLLPLSILTTVPISFVGVYWLFYFTDTSMEIVTLIGCILMVGLIVNNGIVIVDHINQLRKRHPSRHRDTIIAQAGRDRFRPVMMTAMTTILGVIPLAIANSGGAMIFRGLGRAIIGGMTVGTMLTLLIVPLFYASIDDIRNWLSSFAADLSRLGKRRHQNIPPGSTAETPPDTQP
ncbi:MAG: efflux RND transporter permease subunit [Candidatus Hydrogenedentota bacterium]